MRINVIGIDPSMNNTAIALLLVNPCDHNNPTILTRHIKKLEPGEYSNIIKQWKYQFSIKAGFVEDFSNIGGPDTNKTAIKAVSHSGGMAEEAIVAAGIPMQPITVREWRKIALGAAPKHPTKGGRISSYYTKGDMKFNIPDNVTPALLKLFQKTFEFDENRDEKELEKIGYSHLWAFEDIVTEIAKTKLTSRRIQIVFGKSLDELEAAAIALAGYRLIKSGQIEGL